jgi:hypothetical protein
MAFGSRGGDGRLGADGEQGSGEDAGDGFHGISFQGRQVLVYLNNLRLNSALLICRFKGANQAPS